MARFFVAAIAALLVIALVTAALVEGVIALDRALTHWLHDPALAAALSMATLLVLALLAMLIAWASLRRRDRPRRRAAAPDAGAELGELAQELTRKHPWLAVASAFAAGFLASGSKSTEQLLAELLRQAKAEAGQEPGSESDRG